MLLQLTLFQVDVTKSHLNDGDDNLTVSKSNTQDISFYVGRDLKNEDRMNAVKQIWKPTEGFVFKKNNNKKLFSISLDQNL